MNFVPPEERPPVGEDTSAFFNAIQLPWRPKYSPKYVPRYVRDPATRNPPPPDPEDAASCEDLEMELSLLDQENCTLETKPNKSNPHGSTDPNRMATKVLSWIQIKINSLILAFFL